MRSLFSPFNTAKSKVINLDSSSFEKKIMEDEDAVVIDVRTKPEHTEVRIPNTELMDLYSPDFRSRIENLDRNKNYYLYCHSGNRSYHAGMMMIQMGFQNVYNLAPGIIGWLGEVENN